MLKKVYLFSCLVFVSSCEQIDCVGLAEIYRKDECVIIVKELLYKDSVHRFEIIGKSLYSAKDTIYKEENRWFCTFYNKISINDTIIKRKGELIFNIYKKDTVLSLPWECEGKIYK